MNGRILELAKNPELFQIKDLELLNGEIHKHPYIQSLRALYLLGTHRLRPEKYAEELSITAAYTTDKKILYQLINSGEDLKSSPILATENIAEQEVSSDELKSKFTKIESKLIETPKAVFVNGELNRILFEGEEDFLEREIETIDLESTIESGQIVTQKADIDFNPTENTEFVETKDAKTFSKEIIAEEKDVIENSSNVNFHETEEFLPEVKVETTTENLDIKEVQKFTEINDAESFSKEIIVEEETLIEDSSTLSFHATAEFLPDVKIASNPKKEEFKEVIKPALNKHETEMQRLIAEVEAKMKAAKKQKKTLEETPKSAEVNFSETQSFDLVKAVEKERIIVETKEVAEKETIIEEQPLAEEKTPLEPAVLSEKSIEIKAEPLQEKKPEWKPMSFSSNTPDALISKKTEETTVKKEEIETTKIFVNNEDEKQSVKVDSQTTERPIFNMSFFTQNVSALEKEEQPREIQPVEEEIITAEIAEESNVPQFINTWQSWLKIDRSKEQAQEKIEISITEIKNKVIENFIEKEPRISKLKEESDFVIKERNDDISHLMTETLANLYTEQKLYAKAIKALGILSEKHPDKKPHFDDKIKQIKELRQNK